MRHVSDISLGPRMAVELGGELVAELRARGCAAGVDAQIASEASRITISFDTGHQATLTFTTTNEHVLIDGIIWADGQAVEDLGRDVLLYDAWPYPSVKRFMQGIRLFADRLAGPGPAGS